MRRHPPPTKQEQRRLASIRNLQARKRAARHQRKESNRTTRDYYARYFRRHSI